MTVIPEAGSRSASEVVCATDLPAKLVEAEPRVLLSLHGFVWSVCDFSADVKSCVIPTMTIPMIASTTSTSGS